MKQNGKRENKTEKSVGRYSLWIAVRHTGKYLLCSGNVYVCTIGSVCTGGSVWSCNYSELDLEGAGRNNDIDFKYSTDTFEL